MVATSALVEARVGIGVIHSVTVLHAITVQCMLQDIHRVNGTNQRTCAVSVEARVGIGMVERGMHGICQPERGASMSIVCENEQLQCLSRTVLHCVAQSKK